MSGPEDTVPDPPRPPDSPPEDPPESPPGVPTEGDADLPAFLGSYRVVEKLARGGMGTVLRVWDEELRRNLALKVLEDGREAGSSETTRAAVMGSRFREEAQVTGQLDHPGVVPIHELGTSDDGRPYFTMRLVKGRTLGQVFDLVHAPAGQRDGWTITRALGAILKVCEAMAYAHDKGVVHRDLKPANVMVGRFGETYVMDWGLAKVLDPSGGVEVSKSVADAALASVSIVHTDRAEEGSSRTLVGDVVGTPSYMPPEQAKGRVEEIDERSDVYAVGALLYHLLSGRPPYVEPGDRIPAHTVLRWVIDGPPKPLGEIAPDAHDELVAVAEKAMARERSDRYGSMLELADDLQAYIEGRVVRAYEGGAAAEFRKWVGRNRGVAAGIAATLLALAAGVAAVFVVQSRARAAEEQKNLELAAANTELEQARDEARANAELAREKEALAHANEELARQQEALARANEAVAVRQSYVANIHAAAAALEVGAAEDAWRRLSACPEELRGWEWEHLNLRVDSSLNVIGGLDSAILSIAFSPDGRTIASSSGERAGVFAPDDSVRLWDAETGAELSVLGRHRGRIYEVGFSGPDAVVSVGMDGRLGRWSLDERVPSPDPLSYPVRLNAVAAIPGSERVAVAGYTGEVWIRDADGGNLQSLEVGPSVRSLGASADGRYLAVGLREDLWEYHATGRVQIWSLDTGSLLQDVRMPALDRITEDEQDLQGVLEVEIAPDGRTFAAAARGGIVVWDLDTGEPLHTFRVDDAAVDFAYHPVGPWLASGQSGGSVTFWHLGTGQELETLFGHELTVMSVAFSPSGDRLATGSVDGTIRIWDGQPGSAVTRFQGKGNRSADEALVAFSPDGTRLLFRPTEREAQVLDTRTGKALFNTPAYFHERFPYFSQDGARLHLVGDDSIRFTYDAWTGELLEQRGISGAGEGSTCEECGANHLLSSSPDVHAEAGILVRHRTTAAQRGYDGEVDLVDAETGELRLTIPDVANFGGSALSRDGRLLVLHGNDARLALHDAATGTLLSELEIDARPHQVLLFPSTEGGPDDRLVVSIRSLHSKRLLIYTLTGELEREIQLSSAPIDVVRHGDTRLLLVGSEDGAIGFVDVDEGEQMRLRGHSEHLMDVAASADGLRVASVDLRGNYQLWDTVHPRERTASRRRALAQWAEEAEVRPRVDALFDRLYTRPSVAEAIRADESLSRTERDAALRIATTRPFDYYELLIGQIILASKPDGTPEEAEEALRMAEQFARAFPNDTAMVARSRVRALLGLGRAREALEVLGDELPRADAISAGLAVRAHLQLGEDDEARALLDLVDASGPAMASDPYVVSGWLRLVREAKKQLGLPYWPDFR